jgi:hypothetical protein
MLGVCGSPGCSTLVFGHGTCLEHSTPPTTAFVIGRPFLRIPADESAAGPLVEAAGASVRTS